ncbi:MAG TPA: tRNA dihydrouridine synthase DusB [Firmicutes bacterium]|nr:tRNA dihydrouridine synthase DusB [Bacillota bacterium]
MVKLRIGPVELENPVVLAPMAGVTDLPFRKIAKRFGCGLVCGEMVSDKALLYGNERTKELLRTEEAEGPVSMQLFGSDPGLMARAAGLLQAYPFAFLDINMGCPVPKVVKNGEGAALLKDLPRAAEVVAAVVEAAGRPVTVKMRAGWERGAEVAPQLARLCQEAGAAAVAVHGRYREDFYQGRADWGVIKRVKEAVTIPVIGNGDLFSAEDVLQMKEKTGCAGFMLGRGILGNPWLIRSVVAALAGKPLPAEPLRRERLGLARFHLQQQIACYGEDRGVREMRKHLAWYIKGFPGAARVREHLYRAGTEKEILAILDEYEQACAGEED